MLDGPVASVKSQHVRQASTRSRAKPPMPERDELENRFVKVLVSLEFRRYVFTNTAFRRCKNVTPSKLTTAKTDYISYLLYVNKNCGVVPTYCFSC